MSCWTPTSHDAPPRGTSPALKKANSVTVSSAVRSSPVQAMETPSPSCSPAMENGTIRPDVSSCTGKITRWVTRPEDGSTMMSPRRAAAPSLQATGARRRSVSRPLGVPSSVATGGASRSRTRLASPDPADAAPGRGQRRAPAPDRIRGSSVRGDATGHGVGYASRMTEDASERLLVVANRTESAPQLLEEVGRRARLGCRVALMVPPERHPDAPDWTPEMAHDLMTRAAFGRPVTLVACGDDAAATIGALVERGECDSILLSTAREH